MAQEIRTFQGTYRGFTPTDESPIAMGEIEIIIGPDELVARIATGHMVQEDRIPMAGVRALSVEELKAQYKQGSNATSVALKIE